MSPQAPRGVTRILAIDGGGIRGLIPALVLTEVERLTGKRIAELFDLIAGTSTGGILAAGLTVPDASGTAPMYRAEQLVGLYRDHGKEIFSSGFLRKTWSLLVGAEYSPHNLEEHLKKQLGEHRLADAVTGLLITAYDMHEGKAWFFSRLAAQRQADRNFLLWEVCRATSAAPTYFPPFKLPNEKATLVDGGVFANNPGLCAWVDEHEGIDPKAPVMLLSLGTGSVPHPVTFTRARRWGKIGWAQPAIGAFLDGQSDTAEYQLGRLLDPTVYLRLQPKLTAEHEKMDDASKANLGALERATADLINEPGTPGRLKEFCERLIAGGATPEPQPAGAR